MGVREEAKVLITLDVGDLPAQAKRAQTAIAGIGNAGTISAGQTNAAMRQLPAQFTDIVTSLQGGQSPLTVLLQQGGQIKDSFGGVGNAVRGVGSAISSALTPTVLTVGGVVAVLGTLAYAAVTGASEVSKLKKSLAETGNVAGATVDSLDSLARSIQASGDTTIGSAREVTAELVNMGKFSAEALKSAAVAAVELSKVTGQSASEVAKGFASIIDSPTAFAAKANQAYHFLTVAQYEQIRALEAAGQKQEAAKLGLDALATTMQQRAIPTMSALERQTNAVKQEFSSLFDQLKAFGRDETAEERIARLTTRIAQLHAARNNPKNAFARLFGDTQAGPAETELAAALAAQRGAARAAAEQAAAQRDEDKKIEDDSEAHQAALSSIARAGSANRLAEDSRSLSARSEALQLAFQRDQISATQYQSALLGLDKARIDAELANIDRAKSAEASRKPSNPNELLAQQASLLQIEAQRTVLLEKRDKLLADERAGLRDVAPKARTDPGDALRAIKAQDEAAVEAHDQANRLRYESDRQYLQDLRDENARAAIELITDDRKRGEALIELDRTIAQRRLIEQTNPGAQRDEAKNLIDQRAEIASTQLTKSTYTDVRDAIAAGLGDTQRPIQTFANTLGATVRDRITKSLANSLTDIFLGSNGKGGLFGGGLGGAAAGIASALPGDSLDNYISLVGLAGTRAGGGPVSAGMPYLVGERGPEVIVPRGSGTVIPNGGTGAINIGSVGAGVNRAEMYAAIKQALAGQAAADARRRQQGLS